MIDRELVTRKMVLIDPARVHDSLRSALPDVPAYLAAVRGFLDSEAA